MHILGEDEGEEKGEDLISELKTHFIHDRFCFFVILKDGCFFVDCHKSTFIFFESRRKLYSLGSDNRSFFELSYKQYQVEFQTNFLPTCLSILGHGTK